MGDLFNQIQNFPPEIRENYFKQFTKVQLRRRQLQGWESVNHMIRTSPKCPHEEKIVISRCCPTCKKIEHNNHSCSCIDPEREIHLHLYDPTLVYFVKRLCKACKTCKIQNETAPAA